MQEVIVNVDPEGGVKVEAKGVHGSSCQSLTKSLEDAVGRTTADQKKPEYFQQQVNHATAGTGRPHHP